MFTFAGIISKIGLSLLAALTLFSLIPPLTANAALTLQSCTATRPTWQNGTHNITGTRDQAGNNRNNFAWETTGTYTETSADTATLSGTIVSSTNSQQVYAFNLNLTGRVNPGETSYPPAGSPSTVPALNPDTSQWYYFSNFSGTFTGQKDYAGAVLVISKRGPAAQVGVGANNGNNIFGLGAWFYYTIQSQPTSGSTIIAEIGDLHVDLSSCHGPKTETPKTTSTSTGPDSTSLTLSKSDGNRDITRPGHSFSYTLKVQNQGPADIHDIVVEDTVPGALEIISASDTAQITGNNITWKLTTLTNGQHKDLHISVRVKDGVSNQKICNTASATSGDFGLHETAEECINIKKSPVTQIKAAQPTKAVPIISTAVDVPVTAVTGPGALGLIITLAGASGIAGIRRWL